MDEEQPAGIPSAASSRVRGETEGTKEINEIFDRAVRLYARRFAIRAIMINISRLFSEATCFASVRYIPAIPQHQGRRSK